MDKKIAIELNSIDWFKHALFKDYVLPEALSCLNLTQERILMTIKRSEQLPMVTIARAIGLEKGPFSQTVDKLETRGLVERIRSKEDKRLVYLQLTAKGLEMTEAIEASMEAHFASKMAKLSAKERQQLFDALEVLKHTSSILINR